ncbi:hypothetical protein [Streptococcus mitis]|uniref:hypothetical protein n=1 Tax=Streptococcus mitis TaxID=28037 RepID=UPI00079C05AB|nr:hypothetical protein [Streptococcus mitis]KYF35031.1 hypothetical protein SMIM3IV_01950 [Streptococcus mitis]
MIKISINLLLDAIEDNINDEELQSIDFESYIRKITKEFQGENGEFLVKEEAFETLPLDRDKKDKIIEQIKQNSQKCFRRRFRYLVAIIFLRVKNNFSALFYTK